MIGGTAMASFFVLSEENDTMKREGGGGCYGTFCILPTTHLCHLIND